MQNNSTVIATPSHIPHMAGLREAAAESGLTYYFLRKLCLENKIVHVRCGGPILINMDKLADYLNGESVASALE